MPNPLRTKPDVQTPEKEHEVPDPERFYNPEKLCPDQRKDGTRWSAP